MKKCFFTICTYSYTGLALTLKHSFLKYHKDYDFFIVYVDKIPDDIGEGIHADSILKNYIENSNITKMKFQYDVTEYSTCVKPFAIKYFFSKSYDKVAYFDPDILFFSHFDELDNGTDLAYVTPHHLGFYGNSIDEEARTLNCGIYNCGFIAFDKCIVNERFIEWWMRRLINHCYDDLYLGTYTDQKWIDYISVLLKDNLKIITNLGCNVAPWNINERELLKKDSAFYIREMNSDSSNILCFAHFSGFNYLLLQYGEVRHSFRDIESVKQLVDLLHIYGDELRRNNASTYMKYKYIYNYYSDGTPISKLNRRLYRMSFANDYTDPFDCNSKFYLLMKKKHLLSKTRFDAKKSGISGIDKKTRLVILFFKFAKCLLGVEKYTEFLRAMQIYSRYEKQEFLISEIHND